MIIYVNIMLSVLLTFHIVSREFFFLKAILFPVQFFYCGRTICMMVLWLGS